jgi:hypothetical protein
MIFKDYWKKVEQDLVYSKLKREHILKAKAKPSVKNSPLLRSKIPMNKNSKGKSG